jgi:ubiquinone/menaquinone biosynthesis C-methylase UbiE
MQRLADWQLPPGVSRATWDYVNARAIADDYDSFHASHGLLQFDQQVVCEEVDRLTGCRPASVLDLGCGTGRSLQYAHAQGHRIIGVDLSAHMLRCAQEKILTQCQSEADRARATWLQINMVELDPIEDQSVDLAMCLYSSLGMVRERKNRMRCLHHLHRVVRPNGSFILHVHNRQNWWLTSAGRRLVWNDWLQRFKQRGSHELGDRYYSYRNLPSMFLHIFSRREVKQLLAECQFRIRRWIYLDQSSTRPLRSPRLLPSWRSAGFLVVADRV